MYGFFFKGGGRLGGLKSKEFVQYYREYFPCACLLADICDCLCMGCKLDYPALSNSFKVV